MKTIFEKSNNVDGVNVCEEELEINSVSDEFLRKEMDKVSFQIQNI